MPKLSLGELFDHVLENKQYITPNISKHKLRLKDWAVFVKFITEIYEEIVNTKTAR
jgi:hypothetical protein